MSDLLSDALRGVLSYQKRHQSFSPHYSRTGLVLAETLGIQTLVIGYNRRPKDWTNGFLIPSLDGERIPMAEAQNDPCIVNRTGVLNAVQVREQITGAGPDIFVSRFTCTNTGTAEKSVHLTFSGLVLTETEWPLNASYDATSRCVTIWGDSKELDGRGPDPSYPLRVAVMLPEETVAVRFGDNQSMKDFGSEASGDIPFEASLGEILLKPGESREYTWVFAAGMGEDANNSVEGRANAAAQVHFDAHLAHTRSWLADATADLNPPEAGDDLRRLYLRSVHGLLSNTVIPHDLFRPYHACFPSRGSYASHYLWDACFQSLGYARIHRRITEETLLLLAARQEEDGKIPQFSCATWNRPGAAQPPLIAWAAIRLHSITGNDGFLEQIYPALVRWNRWWFENRDEDGDGLVEYSEALESGWDNSPRWDHGRVEPLELNSFLVVQMRCLGEMAEVLGRAEEAGNWRAESDALGRRMVERMFFKDEGIFYDIHYDTHEPVRIKTPASFIPLWAGVPLPEESAKATIDRYLLSPDHFFGEFPFPVVACNEETYAADGWWRGPIWPNIAHLMLETLRIHGYEKERKAARDRLLRMMADSGPAYELYGSQDGKPLGASELGWSCSVAMEWINDTLG